MKKAKFKKGQPVLYLGHRYIVAEIIEADHGNYYTLDGRLGYVHESELTTVKQVLTGNKIKPAQSKTVRV